jgi:type IV pilus assembly protein PilQ
MNAARVLNAAATVSAAQSGTPAGAVQPAEEKPAYTGEPISLNLKDVDLKDFFRLIHEISGLNIIVDPNVAGSVTTVLDNVPWDQALDLVLRDNGLGKNLEGSVLRIARLDTLTAEQESTNKLVAARIDAAQMTTIFRPLNYAIAMKIATLLKTWSGGGALTKRGIVLVDDRTNTLIISDIQSQIPVIEGIIARLDTKTKQVAIEARIVLATSSFQRTLGAALAGAFANQSGSTIGAGQTGSTASVSPVTSPLPPTFTVPTNASTGFGVVSITNWSSRYLINATIAASELRNEAKTISRPSIITQNNVQGTVEQGVQLPIQTSINNTIAVQYVDATLKLTVTPQITDDGHIFLDIAVNNASPGSITNSAGTSINTQQATTHVLVPDGGTVVFGGVTATQRSNSSTGIPVLEDIPILGHLFKTSTVEDNDQELLFFVSPKILPG